MTGVCLRSGHDKVLSLPSSLTRSPVERARFTHMRQDRNGFSRLWVSLSIVAVLLAGRGGAARAGLLGNSYPEGKLYDVDPATGAATNPRSLGVHWAIAFSPDGTLYGVSESGGTPTPSALFRVNPATGAATLVGPTSPSIDIEGDIAFDPTSGR